MKDVLTTLQAWDAAGLRSAEAILVGTQHSSPRQPGARLVVNEKGAVAGAVSMGCVESDLREHLLGLLRGEGVPRIIHYGSAFAAALEVGLTCGGEIDVWIRRHDPQAAAWKGLCGLKPDTRAVALPLLDQKDVADFRAFSQAFYRKGEGVVKGSVSLTRLSLFATETH